MEEGPRCMARVILSEQSGSQPAEEDIPKDWRSDEKLKQLGSQSTPVRVEGSFGHKKTKETERSYKTAFLVSS